MTGGASGVWRMEKEIQVLPESSHNPTDLQPEVYTYMDKPLPPWPHRASVNLSMFSEQYTQGIPWGSSG